MKERLDVLLVKRNLAESREKAKAVIMSGIVYVDGQKEDKAGSMFDETANVEVRGTTLKYVSRGGLKLEKAMTHFGVTLAGKICMDVGASTGGFTDCMLQNGAVKVYSVDVGHGQLAWKLRNDERVVCMEKTNIRYVTPEEIPDRIQFVSIDVSFISLTKVLGPVKALMEPDGEVVCLIKPQFEAGREKVGKKGVVREKSVHLEVIEMGRCKSYNLDFPDVIALRQQLLPAGEREQNIPCDLKDPAWFDKIDASGGAVFFASGVFYYFLTEQVKALVQGMADAFPGGVLVFDAANRTAVKMIAKTWLRTAKIKDVGAYFAVSDAKSELSPWDSRLQVSSRGYMMGYNDLKDPSVSGFFRFLVKVGDNGMKMQIVKIGFGDRE